MEQPGSTSQKQVAAVINIQSDEQYVGRKNYVQTTGIYKNVLTYTTASKESLLKILVNILFIISVTYFTYKVSEIVVSVMSTKM